MRTRNSIILSTLLAIGLGAGSAAATDANLQFTDLAMQTSPGVVITGNSATASLGDVFEISIFVDNANADAVVDLFTFVNVTPGAFTRLNGVGLPILDEGVFGQVLTPLSGFGNQAVGQAPGTLVGLAHGVVGTGDSTAARNEQATVLIFQVTGTGVFEITQSESGNSTINGVDQGPSFGPSLTVVVPEPGTALLMGLGLAGLAAAGRREN